MAEHRLEELARLSGVSVRNIRAYRERGLLGAPRREGRSAYYSDAHLAQLEVIDRLLRRGFNSAHIAEFFAAVRAGRDLADVLGLHPDIVGPASGADGPEAADPPSPQPVVLDIEAGSAEAGRLLDYGLAERVPAGIALIDPLMADIVRRSPTTQLGYVRVILQVVESVRPTIGALAEAADAASADRRAEVARVVADYRGLVLRVVTRCLDEVLPQRDIFKPQFGRGG